MPQLTYNSATVKRCDIGAMQVARKVKVHNPRGGSAYPRTNTSPQVGRVYDSMQSQPLTVRACCP